MLAKLLRVCLSPERKSNRCFRISRCSVENVIPDFVIASEAISSKTMAFSVRHERDCHGPSGLAMTFCKSFLQINFEE